MRIRKQGPIDEGLREDEVLAAAMAADALAHPVRIQMLRFILRENLARRTVANKDLVREFDYAQATISQHISKLVIGDLIEVQKKGTSSCYYAKIGKLTVFSETLKKIETPGPVNDIPDFLKGGDESEHMSRVIPEPDAVAAENDMPGFLQAGFYDADDIVAELSDFPGADYDEENERSSEDDDGGPPRFL